ncbi:MAG TPA: FecR domain-containing protein [Candidatus Acidoferrales bacterium]|nr:FecR domain-containing protein [Candidatus Acidoferrales bacterium]
MNLIRKSLAAALTLAATLAVSAGGAVVGSASGDVAIVADDGTQVSAAANAAVTAGDSVTTGADSRADVLLGGAARVSLGAQTQVRFVSLDPGARELLIAGGTVDVRTYGGDAPRLATPSMTIRPNVPGTYRVTVSGDGQTSVSVGSGSATIVTPAGSSTLEAGRSIVARTSCNSGRFAVQLHA